MATLAVRAGGALHRLAYDPAAGLSLRAILEPTDFRVRTACLGLGACGLCRVRVLAGEVGAPTTVERAQLEDPLLAGGAPGPSSWPTPLIGARPGQEPGSPVPAAVAGRLTPSSRNR